MGSLQNLWSLALQSFGLVLLLSPYPAGWTEAETMGRYTAPCPCMGAPPGSSWNREQKGRRDQNCGPESSYSLMASSQGSVSSAGLLPLRMTLLTFWPVAALGLDPNPDGSTHKSAAALRRRGGGFRQWGGWQSREMVGLDMGVDREKETVSSSRNDGHTHPDCSLLMTVNYTR